MNVSDVRQIICIGRRSLMWLCSFVKCVQCYNIYIYKILDLILDIIRKWHAIAFAHKSP